MANQALTFEFRGNVSNFDAAMNRARESLRRVDDEASRAGASTARFRQGLGQIGSSALNAAGPLGSMVSTLGGAGGVAAAALAAAAAVAALSGAVKTGLAEIQEMEAATAKLSAVFDGNQAAMGRVLGLVDRLNASQPFFEDDQLASAAAGLRLFDLTEKQVNSLLPVMTDMATVMGVDLDSAAQKVGLALQGQTRGLKAWGIQVKEGSSRHEILNAVLEKASKFHDAAKVKAEGYEGKLAALSKANKDFAGSIASSLKPALESAIDMFTKATKAADSYWKRVFPAQDESARRAEIFHKLQNLATSGAFGLMTPKSRNVADQAIQIAKPMSASGASAPEVRATILRDLRPQMQDNMAVLAHIAKVVSGPFEVARQKVAAAKIPDDPGDTTSASSRARSTAAPPRVQPPVEAPAPAFRDAFGLDPRDVASAAQRAQTQGAGGVESLVGNLKNIFATGQATLNKAKQAEIERLTEIEAFRQRAHNQRLAQEKEIWTAFEAGATAAGNSINAIASGLIGSGGKSSIGGIAQGAAGLIGTLQAGPGGGEVASTAVGLAIGALERRAVHDQKLAKVLEGVQYVVDDAVNILLGISSAERGARSVAKVADAGAGAVQRFADEAKRAADETARLTAAMADAGARFHRDQGNLIRGATDQNAVRRIQLGVKQGTISEADARKQIGDIEANSAFKAERKSIIQDAASAFAGGEGRAVAESDFSFFKKEVGRAGMLLQEGKSVEEVARSTHLNEDLVRRLSLALDGLKLSQEELLAETKRIAEEEAKRGTAQDPIVIIPKDRQGFSFAPRSFFFRTNQAPTPVANLGNNQAGRQRSTGAVY